MLSKCCEGCGQMWDYKKRFAQVGKGEFVYCPTGDRYLVD
jgi:hypothetical protein